jgi:hypothetical protein
MKSSDQQPDKPKKKPQPKAVSKKPPKKDQPEPRIIDLDKMGKNSLTLGQYKELSKRDRSELSPTQIKQLELADRQLKEAASHVASAYQRIDFTAVSRILEAQRQLPATAILENVRQMSLAIEPLRQSLLASSLYASGQLSALAEIQRTIVSQSLLSQANLINSGLAQYLNASFAARTMFAEFANNYRHTIRSLTIDIGSLTAGITISKTETVGFDLKDVQTNDTGLVGQAEVTQRQAVGDFVMVDRAELNLVLNKLDANERELADIKRLLLAGRSSDIQKIAPTDFVFQRTDTVLQLGPYKVEVKLSSKQAKFVRVFGHSAETVIRKWDIEDLIFEAFGERIDRDEADWVNKIRSYIHQLNIKIARDTNGLMAGFFVLDGIQVYINPKYLNL